MKLKNYSLALAALLIFITGTCFAQSESPQLPDTPAGTSTCTVRSARTRPSPRQTSQGSEITVPCPLQVGHGATEMNWPNMLRAARLTSPLPPQPVHVCG